MNRTYAIGDIHGHLDKLREVHEWIERDRDDDSDTVVHVGDLTDRGPDSAGVIQFLIDGLRSGRPWVTLRGNHDRMMSLYLGEPSQQDTRLRVDYSWLHPRLGGRTTLASYGIDTDRPVNLALLETARSVVPDEHKEFLSSLETVYQTEDALFVHAGIRPGIAIEDQVEDDLIWIREPFLSDKRNHGPLIIHGHTPIEAPAHFGNRVNIDTGVAFGGPLTAVVVEDRQVWNLTASGRKLLIPE